MRTRNFIFLLLLFTGTLAAQEKGAIIWTVETGG
jgi:hypothetical protein